MSLILDISNIAILISSVGHNLGARIREDNTVRSRGLVAIPVLIVTKVVGVGVTDRVLKVVSRRDIRVDLSTISWSWSRSWGV